VWRINEGERRLSEMLRGIAKVDRRVLNQQLTEMVEGGILSKKSFYELPPRVEYSLTSLGESLVEVLWKTLSNHNRLTIEIKYRRIGIPFFIIAVTVWFMGCISWLFLVSVPISK